MKENKDEILRKIKERVNGIGYDFFYKGCQSPETTPWISEEILYMWVKPKDEANSELSLDVVPSKLRVSFLEEDKENRNRKECGNLDEMLDYIENYLLNR